MIDINESEQIKLYKSFRHKDEFDILLKMNLKNKNIKFYCKFFCKCKIFYKCKVLNLYKIFYKYKVPNFNKINLHF